MSSWYIFILQRNIPQIYKADKHVKQTVSVFFKKMMPATVWFDVWFDGFDVCAYFVGNDKIFFSKTASLLVLHTPVVK